MVNGSTWHEHNVSDVPTMKTIPGLLIFNASEFINSMTETLVSVGVKKDNVAELIRFSDEVYGNRADIEIILNIVLAASSILLSAFPFGPLLPLVARIGFTILMSPETRYVVQNTLYEVWTDMPLNGTEKWNVVIDNNKVVVEPMKNLF